MAKVKQGQGKFLPKKPNLTANKAGGSVKEGNKAVIHVASVASSTEMGSSSDSASRSLGEDDSVTILKEPVGKSTGTSKLAGGSKPSDKNNSSGKKASWVNLFKDNRNINEGSSLHLTITEEGPINLSEGDDLQIFVEVSPSLVGYFPGKFPGLQALNHIVKGWDATPTISHHASGWMVFKFQSEFDRDQALHKGPYFIFGRPLLLKTMPRFFNFSNEEISTIPVWVTLQNLPLELWSSTVLSRIGSQLGKPIATDKLTAAKERISYARMLVEIDLSKDLRHSVDIMLPGGLSYNQGITYESLPNFCRVCNSFGHLSSDCKEAAILKGMKEANDQREGKGKLEEVNATPDQNMATKVGDDAQSCGVSSAPEVPPSSGSVTLVSDGQMEKPGFKASDPSSKAGGNAKDSSSKPVPKVPEHPQYPNPMQVESSNKGKAVQSGSLLEDNETEVLGDTAKGESGSKSHKRRERKKAKNKVVPVQPESKTEGEDGSPLVL